MYVCVFWMRARIASATIDVHSNMIILFVGECDVLVAAAAAAFYKVHTAPLAQFCAQPFLCKRRRITVSPFKCTTNAVKTTKQQTKMNDGKCYTKVLLIDPVRAIYYECSTNKAR